MSDAGVTAAEPVAAIRIVGAGRRERLALRILGFGAVAIVLAAVTYRDFDLDRFFVPKELVLHLTVLGAAILLLGSIRRSPLTRVDLLLLGFLGLSVVSALFATNPWVAVRAVTLSASSVVLFWSARALREAGLARSLLVALATGVVISSITSLLQAYGVETDLFSANRSPGGTLGNRNFVAHVAAFGFPVVFLCAMRAWRGAGYLLGALGVMIVAGSLILTRSRAGWLAFGFTILVFLLAMLISRPLRRHRRTWARLGGVVVLAGAGVVGAVFLPNSLEWRSENPYLESVQGLANYQEGSGRGRLVQYGRSLRLVASDPLLGVGPGNWPVRYPEHAEGNDPSLDPSAAGTTSNPWPSSDWVAYVSERGILATALLAAALGLVALAGFRRLRAARDADEGIQSAALLATVVAALVAGAFDAVLLLALPAFLIWGTLGLLWPPDTSRTVPMGSALKAIALGVTLVATAVGASRSTAQLVSMAVYSNREDTAWLRRAALIDPGNYRLQLRLARSGSGRSRELRCEHALAARSLFPSARAARNAADGCGE